MAIVIDIDELEQRAKWDRIWMLGRALGPAVFLVVGLLGLLPLMIVVALSLPRSSPDWWMRAVLVLGTALPALPIIVLGVVSGRRRNAQLREALVDVIGEDGWQTRRKILWPVGWALGLTAFNSAVLFIIPIWDPIPEQLQALLFVILIVFHFMAVFVVTAGLALTGKARSRVLEGGARGAFVLLAVPVLFLDGAAAWVWPSLPYSNLGQTLEVVTPVAFIVLLIGALLPVMLPMTRAMRAVTRGDWNAALEAYDRRPALIGAMIRVEALVGANQYEVVEQVALEELRYVPTVAVFSLLDRLAEAQLRRGDIEAAERSWWALLGVHGNSAPAVVGLVRCRLAEHSVDEEALELVELALERTERLWPRQPRGRAVEGRAVRVAVLRALGQRRNAEREREYVDELLAGEDAAIWSRTLVAELLDA